MYSRIAALPFGNDTSSGNRQPADPRAFDAWQSSAMSLGDRLREARIARNLNGVELAAIIGCSPAALSRWETGDRRPKAVDLSRAAEALRVRERWLVTGEGPREPAPVEEGPPIGAAALEAVLYAWTWSEGLGPEDVDTIEHTVREEARAHSTRSASAWRHRVGQLERARAATPLERGTRAALARPYVAESHPMPPLTPRTPRRKS